ncbi:MAG: transporter substrate-binding domain-containing protein [Rhodobacteraceae bacterium]|nr:transporter substrate-binding domain-containing protein [Paracoccaceae bacterium]
MTRWFLAIALAVWPAVAIPSSWKGTQVSIAVTAPWPPYQFRAQNGDIVGLEVDLLNTVCARLEVTCQWHETSFATLFDQVANGRFDVGASGLGWTSSRAKKVIMSCPYNPSQRQQHAGFFARDPDLPMNTSRLAVAAGLLAEAALIRDGLNFTPFADEDSALLAVLDGHADVFVGAYGYVQSHASALLPNQLGQLALDGGGTSFALNPNRPDLASAIEETLVMMSQDGTLERLLRSWIGPGSEHPMKACIQTPLTS